VSTCHTLGRIGAWRWIRLLNHGTSLNFGPFYYRQKRIPYRLDMELSNLLNQFWHGSEEKIVAPAGKQTPVLQTVVGSFTDWTLPVHDIFPTYLLTYCMVQDIVWKAYSHSTGQTTACFLYGTRRSITVLTKVYHWTVSWTSRIQFAPSIPISLRSILILSSYQRPCLPSGLLPSNLQT